MTILASYSDLVSEVASWLNQADTSKVPTFIRLFEAKMNRRLRSPDMERTFTRTAVIGTDTYAINSAIRELREVYIDDDGTLNSYYNYTVTAENIVFDPAPETAFTFIYSGYAVLPGLDSGNTTNWLLDDHPDAYLAGTLAAAYAFERDDDAAAKYNNLLEEIIAEIVREANEKRVPAGPLQMPSPVIE